MNEPTLCVLQIKNSIAMWIRRACVGALLVSIFASLAHAWDDSNPVIKQKAVNIILTSDSPEVTRVGDFRVVDGYLARSARVFRSASNKSHVRFKPRLPLSGSYEIYVWWPQVATGAGVVNATVHDARGRTQLILDQATKGGQWNFIGVFENTAKRPIILSMKAPEGGLMIVDAARFYRTGRDMSELEIEPPRLPAGEVNTDYSIALTINGRPPFTWALAGGKFPEGITLDTFTGMLTGRAADPGRSLFIIEVRDATGKSAHRSYELEMMEPEVSR